MTKTYKTLIKVSQGELNRLRNNLNVYLNKKDELLNQKEQLRTQLITEQDVASKSLEASYAYTSYSVANGIKQIDIDNFVVGLDVHIDEMSEEIIEAYEELKKFEIILENKEKAIKHEEDRKEQIELDEVGITMHDRKEKS